MPLHKINFKSGVNRENTRYTTEGGWYESDKVRFRQGTPEKIGGWARISTNTFLGICRSLFQWVSLSGIRMSGVGTESKFYVESGANYYDITPIRTTSSLTDPFTTYSGLTTVLVTDAAGGFTTGTYVTFTGGTAVGGLTISGEYELTYVSATTYTITVSSPASSNATGGGSVSAEYQISAGTSIEVPSTGWGAGPWGYGPWGVGLPNLSAMRLWSQANFGEDLLFAALNGGIYYWDFSTGLTARAVNITSLVGSTDAPTVTSLVMVSDASRIILAFGCNDRGSATQDPMLIRWSDKESLTDWTPAATNEAGDIRLSHGSRIISAMQTRQEILVWTDTSLYSMQYVGGDVIWQVSLLADNISIISQNSPAVAGGVVYWMGADKFYKYDGHVTTMVCDLRQYIYNDINMEQDTQIFGSTNEGFNEIWWFYCAADATTVGKYVVYNYVENIWYYGTMARTAWIDSGLYPTPVAATYSHNLVTQETGLDDNETGTPAAIDAYILSSEFDIEDGHNFGFVWRILPDITFSNSTATSPQVTMTLYPLKNSGSGYTDPASVAGSNYADVTRTSEVTIEQFTGQILTRVRGRQLAFKVRSNQLGCTWQLGSPRIDIKPDGRR